MLVFDALTFEGTENSMLVRREWFDAVAKLKKMV
jgi:hypothetical protein